MPPKFGHKIDQLDGHRYRTVLMPDGRMWGATPLSYVTADDIARELPRALTKVAPRKRSGGSV